MDANKDSKIARKILYEDCVPDNLVNYYGKIYSQTNERIDLYFKDADCDKKSVLTVLGSGDHVLEAINNGASNITAFDKNKLTYYYLYLKLTALKILDRKDFLNFFNDKICFPGNKFLNKYVYEKIKDDLPYDVMVFFDKLYYEYHFAEFKHKLFMFENYYDFAKDYSFISNNNYYTMQDKIKNVNIEFKNIDLVNLYKNLDYKYDLMFFSNIFDWIHTDSATFNITVKRMEKYLNEDGLIYYYSTVPRKNIKLDSEDNMMKDFNHEAKEYKINNYNSQLVYVRKLSK